MAKASVERPDFAERERALERLTPERQVLVYIFLNVRNTVKIFFHYKKWIFLKYNFLHKIFIFLLKEFRQKIVTYLNEINNFCVKKAFQSINFHDLTLDKRSALERIEKVSAERFIFTER